MKTPWHKLLQYGTALAAVTVILLAGVILLAVVGAAIVLSKILVFIK